MNTKQLHAEVEKKVKRAVDARLWEKASAIARNLGEKDVRQGSDYTIVTHTFSMGCGKFTLTIEDSSYRWGPDYVRICVNGKKVFEVNERPAGDFDRADPLTRTCMGRKRDPAQHTAEYLEIVTYHEGEWEVLLDLDTLRELQDSGLQKERQKRRAAYERELATRPLTNKEKEVAEAFGIEH